MVTELKAALKLDRHAVVVLELRENIFKSLKFKAELLTALTVRVGNTCSRSIQSLFVCWFRWRESIFVIHC